MDLILGIVQAFSTIEYGIYIMAALVTLLILAIFTIFIVSVIKKISFGFSIGIFKIHFGSKFNNINKVGLINSVLEYQEDHIRDIIKIESATMKRQLSYCEQKLSEFKYILTNNYLELLSNKLLNNEDAKLHKDYKSYQIIVSILIRELIDKVYHVSFVENHFDEMDEMAWKNYLIDKSNYILNYKTDYLDSMYRADMIVTREESSDSEEKLSSQLKEVLTSIYVNAKDLAIQSKLEVQKEREGSKLVVQDICKNNGFSLEEK